MRKIRVLRSVYTWWVLEVKKGSQGGTQKKGGEPRRQDPRHHEEGMI